MSRPVRGVLASLLLALFGLAAAEQPTLDSLDAELVRIGAQRDQATAQFDAEDAACLKAFAVTDCQNKVATRRRGRLAELKRQEISVKALQRDLRAQEQLRRSADKAQESAQRQADMATKPAGDSEADRQRAQNEKVQAHQQQAKPAQPKVSDPKIPSGLDAQAQARNRAAYEEKQQALQKRRQDRDQRVLEKGNGGPPLPTAP